MEKDKMKPASLDVNDRNSILNVFDMHESEIISIAQKLNKLVEQDVNASCTLNLNELTQEHGKSKSTKTVSWECKKLHSDSEIKCKDTNQFEKSKYPDGSDEDVCEELKSVIKKEMDDCYNDKVVGVSDINALSSKHLGEEMRNEKTTNYKPESGKKNSYLVLNQRELLVLKKVVGVITKILRKRKEVITSSNASSIDCRKATRIEKAMDADTLSGNLFGLTDDVHVSREAQSRQPAITDIIHTNTLVEQSITIGNNGGGEQAYFSRHVGNDDEDGTQVESRQSVRVHDVDLQAPSESSQFVEVSDADGMTVLRLSVHDGDENMTLEGSENVDSQMGSRWTESDYNGDTDIKDYDGDTDLEDYDGDTDLEDYDGDTDLEEEPMVSLELVGDDNADNQESRQAELGDEHCKSIFGKTVRDDKGIKAQTLKMKTDSGWGSTQGVNLPVDVTKIKQEFDPDTNVPVVVNNKSTKFKMREKRHRSNFTKIRPELDPDSNVPVVVMNKTTKFNVREKSDTSNFTNIKPELDPDSNVPVVMNKTTKFSVREKSDTSNFTNIKPDLDPDSNVPVVVMNETTKFNAREKPDTSNFRHDCKYCDDVFQWPHQLKKHISIKHEGKFPYSCPVCHKKLDRISSLKDHMLVHSNERPFTCDVCQKSFKMKNTLTKHKRDLHSDGQNLKFQCEYCSKVFNAKEKLVSHFIVHSEQKQFECKVCHKKFLRKQGLKEHKVVHSMVKNFECPECGMLFNRKYALKVHARNHLEVKPYRCELCPATFSQSHALKNHVRRHTGERPFRCEICNKSFAQQSTLLGHTKRHTGEKDFECGVCSQRFVLKRRLEEHFRVHTGEKPYECSRCPYRSATTTGLKKHTETHMRQYQRQLEVEDEATAADDIG